ncbi:hypothetical protein [Planosporangium mesophilum]|nr:hypothetical protein [Planosporangium mesophilum]NJC86679.1 hypothetical protein [Planosporangium mesophilum]
MPVQQQIQWVVLPGGVTADGARLRASVFVAPRLSGDDQGDMTLESFPDFLDWPARIGQATFVVEGVSLTGEGPPVFVVPCTRVGEPPDSALWRALFGPQTPLSSFSFDDHSASSMRSFSARDVAASTRGAYAGVAAVAPDRLPSAADMADTPMAGFLATSPQTIAPPEGLAAGAEPEMTPLQRVVDFYQPPTLAQAAFAAEEPAPPMPTPELDFHQMLSLLGDHPTMLRRLGLVVDLEVPAESVVQFGGVSMRIRPAWQSLLGAVNNDVTPLSAYRHLTPDSAPDGRRRFTRASELGELAADAGLKFLPESDFSLEQSDVDGAALKLVSADPEALTGLPTVRSGGIALVRDRRDEVLRGDFERARLREEALGQGGLIELGDDDLVRGHRLDVFDVDAGRWRSLHERVVEYRIPGHPLEPVQDEGFFQVSLARPGIFGAQPYLHDQVVSWDGWSLSAPRPGKVLPPDPRAPDPTQPDTALIRPENAVGTAMPLQIETSARPGSLPRLRFGRKYRVRVRTVDLAGNGPGLDEDLHLPPEFLLHYALPGEGSLTYRRFEPVPAPELVPRQELSGGAAPDRMVIRTFAEPGEVVPDERHVVLPKAPLELVERQGMLDGAIGSGSADTRRAGYEIARREKGQLATVHPEERIAVPYLPDPLAEGVVFFGLPGLPEDEAFSVDCRGEQWFAPLTFRIRLVGGTGQPRFDADARVLTVALPPSGVATVRVSSKVIVDDNVLGMLDWCRRELSDEQFATVRNAVEANRHWMVTPWRELTLVHAVQHPLRVPTLEISGTGRELGSTNAKLSGSVGLHPASTERLDVQAEWAETRDDETADGPRVQQFAGPVFTVATALARDFEGAPSSEVPATFTGDETMSFNASIIDPSGPVPHEFGDTRRRVVRYRPTLTSSFSEYFPPGTDCSVVGEPVEVSIPNTAPPAVPELHYVIPTVRWEQSEPEPGQVVRRRVGGGLRVYLDRPWFSSGDGEVLGIIVLDPAAEPTEVDYPWVTLLGVDPIRFGPTPRRLDAASFRNADSVLTGAFVAQIGPQGGNMAIVCYVPEYDAATGRWFSDLELDLGDAYFSFLRLSLIRFQEDSLGGAQLSPIVLADPVQTLPDRTLSVRKDPQSWHISLTGPTYVDSDTTPRARAVARWEQRTAPVVDEDLGWEPLREVELTLDLPDEAPTIGTWSGDLPVPVPAPPGRLRLAVIEEAPHTADDPAVGTLGRVIYSDTIPV